MGNEKKLQELLAMLTRKPSESGDSTDQDSARFNPIAEERRAAQEAERFENGDLTDEDDASQENQREAEELIPQYLPNELGNLTGSDQMRFKEIKNRFRGQ